MKLANNMTQSPNKQINYGLEILRVLMCFEVICIHFYSRTPDGVFAIFYSYRNNAVPVFILISFLLSKRLYESTTVAIIKKRIWRLFLPQLIWALVYWGAYSVLGVKSGREMVNGVSPLLWQITTGHSDQLNPTMWYQSVLIVITLIFGICCVGLNRKKIRIVFCVLLVASYILQYSGINYSVCSRIRYEIQYPLGRLIEVIPYAIVGYFLVTEKIVEMIEKNKKIYIVVSIVMLFLLRWVKSYIPNAKGFGYSGLYLFFTTLMITLFFYCLPLGGINGVCEKIIRQITRYTLGIYCMHRLVAFFIEYVYDKKGLTTGGLSMNMLIYFVCYAIAFAISVLPFKGMKKIVE